ncbi:MAG: pseudouridine synthase [Deltaproteobacteria bacterium]|nr:pseudouridine synthase [Deltaproteobacteria bacterium]
MEERLQKILSQAGIASRRAAEKLLAEGRISVNRKVVTEPGSKADPQRDDIRVDGKLISLEIEKVYLLLHKPPGVVTTLSDPQGRPIVTDLLKGITERVYPVGRLDYDSEGLLILTNDGEFAQQLQHPRYGIPKTYRVKVEGRLQKAELKALEKGIDLSDGPFKPADLLVEKANPASSWLSLTLTDGRNRVIRRAFDAIGHSVIRLIRVAVADILLEPVKEGNWRMLTPREVERLLALAKKTGNEKNCLDIHRKINNSRRN